MPNLSLRLKTIADMIPFGAKICDIGTDHGYLPIFLKKEGKVQSVIATDVNIKPLKRAENNISAQNISGIELRLCDGLEGIKFGEVDTVIIAGMGGEVISGILEKGNVIVNDPNITLVMQPTTSPEILREYLQKNGFKFLEEIPVFENQKTYSVMKCRFDGEIGDNNETFNYIGLIKPDSDEGKAYIEKQKLRCFKCMKSLEKIPKKQQEYLHYKRVYEEIMRMVKDYGV